MVSFVSKLLFTLSGLAVVTAIAYGLGVDERSGVALFGFVALAAAIAGGATSGGAVPDLAPHVPADAPAPQRRATTVGSPPRGSAWPLVAAAAVTLLLAGAAIGPGMVLGGAIAVVVATAGWLSKVWGEDPSWIPRVRDRVTARLLAPMALPVATFLLAATIAISVSRILLAVSKEAATGIAIIIAIAILGTCAWVASRPRLRSSGVMVLAAAAVTSMLGAGIAGAVSGERDFAHEGGEEEEAVIKVAAREVAFDTDKITAPAGKKVQIEFENFDDVYHNVAIYKGEGTEAVPVFNGEGFAGEDDRTYEFEAPPPGTYVFVCDFHANMKGTFVSERR